MADKFFAKANPFKVLELPTNATKSEIVEHATMLVDLAETDEERVAYREALQELITNPSVRLQYELFEIPDTRYEDEDKGWDDFVSTYGGEPVDLNELVKETPPINLEDFDLAALIRLVLDGRLSISEADIRTAIDNSPFLPGYGPPPLEVQDVIFG